jgi:hypothetical protein
MTDKEHALIMTTFTRQTQYIQMLIDMLKSKEIIQGDDVAAFDSVVRSDPASVSAFLRVTEQYHSFANQLHLELPKLPPSL